MILSSITTSLNPILHMGINSWPHASFPLGCLMGPDLLSLVKVFQSKKAHPGTIEAENSKMQDKRCMYFYTYVHEREGEGETDSFINSITFY